MGNRNRSTDNLLKLRRNLVLIFTLCGLTVGVFFVLQVSF